VSPFSPRTVFQNSDDESDAYPNHWRLGGTSIYGETFTRQQRILVNTICVNEERAKWEGGKSGDDSLVFVERRRSGQAASQGL